MSLVPQPQPAVPLRPSTVCARLLAALDVSDGRRRRRKRDTTPDAIGLAVKRRLLEQAIADDPCAENFESWLVKRCELQGMSCAEPDSTSSGALRAMALDILGEWTLAQQQPGFWRWLEVGAPSQDR